MAQTVTKYGVQWPVGDTPEDTNLQIEMGAITHNIGDRSQHYEAMRQLLWPELDPHRWHNLIRDTMVNNKYVVLAGPASTGKTHEAAWLFLCEYLIYPNDTCVLISSTDIRGLRGRIWSEMTSLWQRAKDKFPWLPGNLLDSRVSILTDALDEETFDRRARDYRKCIQGVPCRNSAGSWTGLNRYAGWKQKRMRLIADESCFPAGTLVDTPLGQRPIEQLRPGDLVIGALGTRPIRRTMLKQAPVLVRLTMSDGRQIVTTPFHRFFTQKGWKFACHLNQSHYMLSGYEAMRLLRSEFRTLRQPTAVLSVQTQSSLPSVRSEFCQNISLRQTSFLQQVLRLEMDVTATEVPEEVLYATTGGQDQPVAQELLRRASRGTGDYPPAQYRQSHFQRPSSTGQDQCYFEAYRAQTQNSWWQWDGTNQSRKYIADVISGSTEQLCHFHRQKRREWLSHSLQGGYCISGNSFSGGSRRLFAQLLCPPRAGCEENGLFNGAWVDRIEIIESANFDGTGNGASRTPVYNLEVAGHPSYCVNGLLVHNSQMQQEFVNGISNLNSNPDFKCVVLGNFDQPTDCLGRCAEPVDGWGAHMAPRKTEIWDVFYPLKGKCINLIGFDSPNFDYPKKHPDDPDRFPYLLGPKRIEEIRNGFGEDSVQFMSMCWGSMKISSLSHRVLTRELCAKGQAFDEATWDGSPRTRVAFLDSAWGGDRCVFTWGEFGRDVGGKVILELHPPELVPLGKAEGQDADYAMADWCKNRCESLNIVPDNFGHDSTGRGSLGTALARLWSAQCNPVEFGGQPTERPVTADYFWTDQLTHQRRLKLCSEHYLKFVTELWFSVRYAVEAGQVRGLARDTAEEFYSRVWRRAKDDKIEVEPKSGTAERPGMKQRTGKSPDLADSAAGCLEMARRRGFQISKLANESISLANQQWMLEAKRRQKSMEKAVQLQDA